MTTLDVLSLVRDRFLQVLLAVVCTQFIRVFDLSTNASAPVHTFYLPATVEDTSNDGAGSSIRDVELVPPRAPASTSGSNRGSAHGRGSRLNNPALLATAIVLTGAGRLYAKGVPAPISASLAASGGDGSSGTESTGYPHDGEIRQRLVIPCALDDGEGVPGATGCTSGGSDAIADIEGMAGGNSNSNSNMDASIGGNCPGASGGGPGDADAANAGVSMVGSARQGGSESGGSRGRSESVGGASAGGGSGQEDEEVESPVSAAESPSYLYLSAFAGCDFDDAVDDSPDESLVFSEPGLRRRGWAAAAAASNAAAVAAASSSSSLAVSSARGTTSILSMSPAAQSRGKTSDAAAKAAVKAAATCGALHYSHRMNVLVVSRGGKPTIALRLQGNGTTSEVVGGFMLLPRCQGGSSGGTTGDVDTTPTAQSDRMDSRSGGGVGNVSGGAAAARATAAATLSVNSCLPPYTRFVDYWDGANEVADTGEDAAGAGASAPETASMVCVAAGGGRANSDRVLAMRIGGGVGDNTAVRDANHNLKFCLVFNFDH